MNTRKWIGATEIAALFRSLQIRYKDVSTGHPHIHLQFAGIRLACVAGGILSRAITAPRRVTASGNPKVVEVHNVIRCRNNIPAIKFSTSYAGQNSFVRLSEMFAHYKHVQKR